MPGYALVPTAPVVASAPSFVSRNSAVQTDFRERVLVKYGKNLKTAKHCLVCRNGHLDAAHIIPIREHSRARKLGITVNETKNGIPLCRVCHGLFDANLWYINSDRCIRMTHAILDNFPKLRQFDGKVLTPEEIHFNTKAMRYRRRLCRRRQKKREQMRQQGKVKCKRCLSVFSMHHIDRHKERCKGEVIYAKVHSGTVSELSSDESSSSSSSSLSDESSSSSSLSFSDDSSSPSVSSSSSSGGSPSHDNVSPHRAVVGSIRQRDDDEDLVKSRGKVQKRARHS
jgi:hypothetical protein